MPRKAAPWWRSKSDNTGEYYVTIKGKQTRLGVTDKTDEAGAWAAFQAIISKAVAEQGGKGIKPGPVSTLTANYLDSQRHKLADKTVVGYSSCLRHFVARFGDQCIVDLDPESVEISAAKEDWSDSHRANYLWTVQALVRWCGRKDFKLDRPAKESRGAEAVISDEVYAKILRETRGDFYQLMRLLWAVGSRPMESGTLTAEMVDWASGTITLKAHKTKRKTGRVRILYLNSEALAILREQCNRYPSGPLFRGKAGKPLSLHAVMTRMIRLSSRIGEHVTAGHFRHTFATRALAAGIPDTHVAALLGHTSTAMIHKHYSHVGQNAKLLREQAEKLAG